MTALRTGPVAVTGAGGHVGRALQRRLAGLPNIVRPLGRRDDLQPAFADADAVVHLAGTLQAIRGNTYEEANRETVRATVDALAGSDVERVVFLSYVGADPSSPNAYLRTKGEAEELLRASGREVVVLRATFVCGPPDDPGPTATAFIAHDGKPVTVLGSGRQRLAPVFVGDLVEAIVQAALAPGAPTGTFAVAGPDVLSADELVRVLNGDAVRVRHLRGMLARALARLHPELTPALVDVMLADCLPDGPAAHEAFGSSRRSLREVYGSGAREMESVE